MNSAFDFINYHAYLWMSLCLLELALLSWVLVPSQRRLMLISGLLSTPFALTSYFFVPDYWQPDRMAVFITGFEDIIFSFANGMIVICLFYKALPCIFHREGPHRVNLNRFMFCIALGTVSNVGLIHMGFGAMAATLLTGCVFWAYFIRISTTKSLSVSFGVGAAFCILYSLVFKTAVHLSPTCHNGSALQAWVAM